MPNGLNWAKGMGATWTSQEGWPMRHQTLGFGAAATKGSGGGAPRAAPHLGLVEGLIPSPSPYIRAAHSPLLLIHSFPSSPPLLSLALAPVVWSWLGRLEVLEVLPPFGRRRAAGFPVRSFLLPLPLLDRSPEDVCTPYVYKTAEVPWFRYFVFVGLFVYSTLRSASLCLLHQRSCGT